MKHVWHPYVDTSLFDEMLNDFYAAITQRTFSFCEIGLLELTLNKTEAIEKRRAYLEDPKNEKISNIVFYHRLLKEQYGITIPSINTLWKKCYDFRTKRNTLTHEELWSPITFNDICENIDKIVNMLLFIEEKILCKNE